MASIYSISGAYLQSDLARFGDCQFMTPKVEIGTAATAKGGNALRRTRIIIGAAGESGRLLGVGGGGFQHSLTNRLMKVTVMP